MRTTARSKPDSVTVGAVEVARAALLEDVDSPSDVGEHLGHVVEGERLVTHSFACTRPGYVGWRWAVTLTRASRQRTVTVDEVVLLPGEDAITAPDWVPYRDRVRPGDLTPGDLLPVADDDPRLVPTYSFGDDPLDTDEKEQVRDVARELFLGRPRTLGPEGREQAAQRWWDGDGGPDSPLAQAASDSCDSCGFLVRLNGPLSGRFGVCANGDANDDGRVVALGHGCGAHSEVRLAKKHEPLPMPEPIVDDFAPGDVESF
ncbi:DUF3027 domain-containing protein [Nocardioides bruguierae]|uniref:DUF3027 domain-containing protein n=1 Tax=Nocardioides bruguierae TaxID=2945102 RepID=A0A9X2D6B8_9ACTN|nr:DUF3027 domain-containing protein [Nocardioides bruguierae]MCM0619880.1 DUF3027 domain-containing protein [Nocardioides bruguierae]